MTTQRGESFRAQATALAPDLGPAGLVLLDEACRIIDRLDLLADLLATEPSGPLLAEARAQSGELRQVLKALDLPSSPAASEAPTKLELLLGGGAG